MKYNAKANIEPAAIAGIVAAAPLTVDVIVVVQEPLAELSVLELELEPEITVVTELEEPLLVEDELPFADLEPEAEEDSDPEPLVVSEPEPLDVSEPESDSVVDAESPAFSPVSLG